MMNESEFERERLKLRAYMRQRREAELAELREREAGRTAYLNERCVCGRTRRQHTLPDACAPDDVSDCYGFTPARRHGYADDD